MELEDTDRVIDCSVNGECSRCCHCCGPLIPLTMREANRMKQLYKEDKNVREVVERNCSIIKNKEGGFNINLCCPFADLVNHRCSIYNDRPQVCRVFRCHNYNGRDIKDCEQKAHYNHINYYKDRKNGDKPKNFITTFKLLNKGLMHNLYIFYHVRHEMNRALDVAKKTGNEDIFYDFLQNIDDAMHFDKGTYKQAVDIMNQSYNIDVNKMKEN